MPKRREPPANASNEQRWQYENLQAMDAEQRSQKTVDRINLVRERLTAANDNLEAIRQKVLKHAERIDSLTKDAKESQSNLDAAATKALRRGKSLNDPKIRELKKIVEAKMKELSAAKSSLHQTIPSEITATSRASVAATMEINESLTQMKLRAAETAKWLSRIISDKHGKTLTFRVAQATQDRASYSLITKKIYMDPLDRTAIYLHEAAHFLEDCGNSLVHSLSKGFLHHRGKTEPAEWVGAGNLFEIGVGDDWTKMFGTSAGKYVGKYYDNGTEVLSMGVQRLYEDPLGFAKNDPESFKFVVGILRGDLL